MKIIVILYSIIFTCSLFSQNDSLFKLPELTITQMEKGSLVAYEFEKEPNRFLLNDSSLIANPNKYNYAVRLGDVKKITFHYGANAFVLATSTGAIGMLIGFVAAGISAGHGSSPDFKDRLVGALYVGAVFAIIGGVVGAILTNNEHYDLSKIEDINKKNYLKRILKKNRIK